MDDQNSATASVQAQIDNIVTVGAAGNTGSHIKVEAKSFSQVSLHDPVGVETALTTSDGCKRRIAQACRDGARQFQLIDKVIQETFDVTVEAQSGAQVDAKTGDDLKKAVNATIDAGTSSSGKLHATGANLFTNYTDKILSIRCP